MAGKLIIKGSGPGSNTPAPRFLHPEAGPYSETILEAFVSQLQRASELAERARGLDLSGSRFRNPFVSFLPMNLFDPFEILAVHAERHVRQIEERATR